MRRIGVLMASAADEPVSQGPHRGVPTGLSQLGWTDDRNVRIDTAGQWYQVLLSSMSISGVRLVVADAIDETNSLCQCKENGFRSTGP